MTRSEVSKLKNFFKWHLENDGRKYERVEYKIGDKTYSWIVSRDGKAGLWVKDKSGRKKPVAGGEDFEKILNGLKNKRAHLKALKKHRNEVLLSLWALKFTRTVRKLKGDPHAPEKIPKEISVFWNHLKKKGIL